MSVTANREAPTENRLSRLPLVAALGMTLLLPTLGVAAPQVQQTPSPNSRYQHAYAIQNEHNRYVLIAEQRRQAGRPPQTVIGVFEPFFQANFYGSGFIGFELDGVNSQNVPVRVTAAQAEDQAGIIVDYAPIEGKRPRLCLFMDEQHAVLWGELRIERDPDAPPVGELSVRLWTRPNNNRPRDTYERFVVTPATEHRVVPTVETIKPAAEADWFFVADRAYDAASRLEGESWGPSFLIFDRATVEDLRFTYGNHATVTFEARLQPDQPTLRFAVWEHARVMDNAEALAHLRQQASTLREQIRRADLCHLDKHADEATSP